MHTGNKVPIIRVCY